MNASRRQLASRCAALALSICLPLAASGQAASRAADANAGDFPVKPIRLVVAQSAGVTPDVVARILAQEMSKVLGQPVVVENKPGAGGIVGYEYVAKAPADGYTLALVTVSALAGLPATTKDLRFDPVKELPPFIGLIEGRLVFVSSSTLPWKSLKELAAYGKANPGKLNYGAPNESIQLATVGVLQGLGVDAVSVPYSGAGTYHQALLTGDIHMGFTSEQTAMTLGDKMRVLAVTGRTASPGFRQAPTFSEAGFPLIPGNSFSMNAPRGVPAAVLARLHAAAAKALQSPEVQASFSKLQMDILNDPPAAAAKRLAGEVAFFHEMAKKIGLQPK